VVLTHYVIVRRDLPFGTLCAQLTHAAGESFYRLPQFPARSSSESTSHRLGDGGSNPSERTNAGVAQCSEQQVSSLQVGGSNPSPGSISLSHTIAVVLGARNELRLLKLERTLLAAGIPHVAIREPDAPWHNQLMAIGLVPAPREAVSRYMKDFQTIRTLQERLF
jgi:hypothetical protein